MSKAQSLNTIVTYIDAMANTTIQISKDLLNELKAKKRYSNESYEDVLWDLLEDTMELSEETLKDIEIARKEYKEGKTHTLAEVKKELGL